MLVPQSTARGTALGVGVGLALVAVVRMLPSAHAPAAVTAASCTARKPPLYEPHGPPTLNVGNGMKAPEISLMPLGGSERVSLSGLLATKPVVLEFGSATWPFTVPTLPYVSQLRAEYGDAFHYVFVYIPEVHPHWGVHPYSGEVMPAEQPYPGGILTQEMTMEERIKAAEKLESMNPGTFDYILLDDLPSESGEYNPTWCAWGAAPNPGWVIAQDGTVKLAQFFLGHGMPMVPFEDGMKELKAAMSPLI